MFESFSESLGYFGLFSVIGFIFGMIYYIGQFLKITLCINTIAGNILDGMFMIFCGLIVFLFSVGIGTGSIRLYYLIALALGFAVYSVSLGRLTILFADVIRTLIMRVFTKLSGVIAKVINPMLRNLKSFFVDILQKISKFTEKYKIHLKNDGALVYNDNTNKMGKIVGKGGENRNVIKAKVSKNS